MKKVFLNYKRNIAVIIALILIIGAFMTCFSFALPQIESQGATENDVITTTDYVIDKTNKTYTIKTKVGFNSWGVNSAKYLDYKIILTANVSLYSYKWTPVGTETAPFTGTFDGKGFAITDFNISNTTSSSETIYAGLFGVTKNARIEDVNISGTINVTGIYDIYVGGIVG